MPALKLRRDASEHLYQLLTGLILLREAGEIELELSLDDEPVSPHVATLVVEGRRLAYDMCDGYNLGRAALEQALDRSDVYFKRSFDPRLHQGVRGGERIRPYGLNYGVATKHRVFRRLAWNAGPRSVRTLLRLAFRRDPITLDELEAVAREPPADRAVFLSRVWDPREARGSEAVQRERMNELRARCVRALRRELGPRVVAGLAPTEYASARYPDCLLERWLHRRRLLELMKASAVGVATRGLHASNGWTLGEYVATGRAVVTERLAYAVPGGFRPGRNYLEFASAEECVEKTAWLLDNPGRRAEVQEANRAYYLAWLRPDRLVSHTLRAGLEGDA